MHPGMTHRNAFSQQGTVPPMRPPGLMPSGEWNAYDPQGRVYAPPVVPEEQTLGFRDPSVSNTMFEAGRTLQESQIPTGEYLGKTISDFGVGSDIQPIDVALGASEGFDFWPGAKAAKMAAMPVVLGMAGIKKVGGKSVNALKGNLLTPTGASNSLQQDIPEFPEAKNPFYQEIEGTRKIIPQGRHGEIIESPLGETLKEQKYPDMSKMNVDLRPGDINTKPTNTELFGQNNPNLNEQDSTFIKRLKTSWRNKTAIHFNAKTGMSIDFSTSCTKRGCGGGACAYCYVEHDRSAKKAGLGTSMAPKNTVENDYEHELLLMSPGMVNEHNKNGGIRMFSFGDYRPDKDSANVGAVLEDAKRKGLYVKAITKEKQLIDDYGDHPNFRANISTDMLPRNLSKAPTIEEAQEWAGGRDNIKIRGVALNRQEAEKMGSDERINVITLYHGPTNWKETARKSDPYDMQRNGRNYVRTDRLFTIVKEQNPELTKELGGEDQLRAFLDEWEDMGNKTLVAKDFQQRFPTRTCCAGGKCSTDQKAKCGFGMNNVGAILPGVAVGAWFGLSEDDNKGGGI